MYGAMQQELFLLEKGDVSMEWELEKKVPYNQALDVIQKLSQVHCAEAVTSRSSKHIQCTENTLMKTFQVSLEEKQIPEFGQGNYR